MDQPSYAALYEGNLRFMREMSRLWARHEALRAAVERYLSVSDAKELRAALEQDTASS